MSGKNVLYPVHSLNFHGASKGFVSTAGGDGMMYFWDIAKKNRIRKFDFNKQPVTATRISHDGKHMAVALGYDWAKGIEFIGSFKPKICVYPLEQKDLQY